MTLEQDWNAERTARLLAEEKLKRLEDLAYEMENQAGRATTHYADRIRKILEGGA